MKRNRIVVFSLQFMYDKTKIYMFEWDIKEIVIKNFRKNFLRFMEENKVMPRAK